MEFDGLRLVVWMLASWRLAAALHSEDGPWGIIRWLRERSGVTHDEDGIYYPEGSVFSCVGCLSFWTGLGFLLLPGIVSVPFAISAGAIIVEVVVGRLRDG